MPGRRWTENEIETLKRRFANSAQSLLEKLLPEHTWNGIVGKAREFNLHRTKDNAWSDGEIDVLRKHYERASQEFIQSLLPGRTWMSIVSIASTVGVKRPVRRLPSGRGNLGRSGEIYGNLWTPREIAVMRAKYPTASKDELLNDLPGRTWATIQSRGALLGIPRIRNPERYSYWTSEEERVVLEHYQTAPHDTILAMLPNRKWESITGKAHSFGLRRIRDFPLWTEREIAFLASNYHSATKKEVIAGLPGRDWKSIAGKAVTLGLRRGLEIKQVEKQESAPRGTVTRINRERQLHSAFAVSSGWPSFLSPRQVQLLNVLAAHDRPMTRIELCERLGMPRANLRRFMTVRLTGKSRDCLKELIDNGLVLFSKRTTEKGHGAPWLYMLSPLAITIFQQGVVNHEQTEAQCDQD